MDGEGFGGNLVEEGVACNGSSQPLRLAKQKLLLGPSVLYFYKGKKSKVLLYQSLTHLL